MGYLALILNCSRFLVLGVRLLMSSLSVLQRVNQHVSPTPLCLNQPAHLMFPTPPICFIHSMNSPSNLLICPPRSSFMNFHQCLPTSPRFAPSWPLPPLDLPLFAQVAAPEDICSHLSLPRYTCPSPSTWSLVRDIRRELPWPLRMLENTVNKMWVNVAQGSWPALSLVCRWGCISLLIRMLRRHRQLKSITAVCVVLIIGEKHEVGL